ncbi:MAG: response regulator [Oscillospiraceae bacterium]|nr:response regulator [Oscillospiraceae bacterium]
MRAICVDDESARAEEAVALCLSLPQIDDAVGFTRPLEALSWLEEHSADLALLDIRMPEMDGLALAAEIRRLRPDMALIFLTAHAEYAVEAFALHVSGYLLKPLDRERLAAEVEYVRSAAAKTPAARVTAKTFGNFDLLVDGQPVRFETAKCKELLAYLVDRQGSCVTRAEAVSVLWEDRPYDRGMQKQMDVYIRRLRSTLRTYGIEDIFELQRGTMRILPEKIDCDAWRFFDGDGEVIRRYRGEYMNGYSWASLMESELFWKVANRE